MKLTVKHTQGKHWSNIKSTVVMLLVSVFKIPFTVEFSQEAIDKLKLVTDEDLGDWCKIVGRKSIKPSKWYGSFVGSEEQMWVYSIREGKLAIGDYYRREGKMDTPNDRYSLLEPGEESEILTGQIYKSIFPTTPYYCGNDSNNNGIGGVPPADFEYIIRIK